MAKNQVTTWECDAPMCSTVAIEKQEYSYQPPVGWSTINFAHAENEEECVCSCHEYDEEEPPHDEDDCSCMDTESGAYTYCIDCTSKFKMQFLPHKKGSGLL